MKIIIYLLFTFLFLISTNTVRGATPPPSPEEVQIQIDELKNRIASRVAQLKLVEKRGIIGAVSDVSQTQITLTDIKDETRFIDVDELTKFEGEARDFGISDIKKGQTLGILGLYNKQSRRLLARAINEITLPRFINGVVESRDDENFSLTIATDDNKVHAVDVETTTKTFSYTKEDGLARSGFSKIEAGQNVIISGFSDRKDANRITGDRILIFPEIPKNPNIAIEVLPTPAPSAVPSTGSGKKLTPIASPKPPNY